MCRQYASVLSPITGLVPVSLFISFFWSGLLLYNTGCINSSDNLKRPTMSKSTSIFISLSPEYGYVMRRKGWPRKDVQILGTYRELYPVNHNASVHDIPTIPLLRFPV